jgi:hypothetical protein
MQTPANPHGWLDPAEVERKRLEVPAAMWSAEYDLQEPTPDSRAFEPGSVEAMFSEELGVFRGAPGEYIEIEPPEEGGRYSTGADWAKERDWTVIATVRSDVEPARLVAYERIARMPWPMLGRNRSTPYYVNHYRAAGSFGQEAKAGGAVLSEDRTTAGTTCGCASQDSSLVLKDFVGTRGADGQRVRSFARRQTCAASVVPQAGHGAGSPPAIRAAAHGPDRGRLAPLAVRASVGRAKLPDGNLSAGRTGRGGDARGRCWSKQLIGCGRRTVYQLPWRPDLRRASHQIASSQGGEQAAPPEWL